MEKYPAIIVEFDEPRSGYWDYGKKSGGTFEPEVDGRAAKFGHPWKKGADITWGCFELNFWFRSGAGKSFKDAAQIAMRRLKRMLRVPAKVTIQWKEVERL